MKIGCAGSINRLKKIYRLPVGQARFSFSRSFRSQDQNCTQHNFTTVPELPLYRGKNLFGFATDFIANSPLFVERMEPVLGDFYRVKVPRRKLYVTSRPEVIRFVLQTHAGLFRKSVIYQEMKQFLGEGLLTSEGDLWRRNRRLAQPVFYKKYLGQLFDTMETESAAYVDRLISKTHAGTLIDVSLEMMQVTSDIVMKALFSSEDDKDKQKTYEAVTFFQELAIRRVYWPLEKLRNLFDGRLKRFRRLKSEMDDRMYALIRERRAEQAPPSDLLSMLLASTYEDTGEGMTDQQLRDELITLYMAGHETSATALSWTLYLLAQHPDVVRKMRAEIDELAGSGSLRFEDLQKLGYTRQVIDEGMRLYPPAYIVSRILKENTEIEGVPVPAGATLYMSIYGLHRSPRHWESPRQFDPDRFSPEKVKDRPNGIYMPFGAGARMCIGNHFAIMEMQILLAYLVRAFDWEIGSDKPIEFQPLLTLKPRHGIQMRVLPR